MITQADIKIINSLNNKKFRQKYNLFVAEGNKIIKEFVKSNYIIKKIYHTNKINANHFNNSEVIDVNTLKKISFLKNAQSIICLIEIPQQSKVDYSSNTIILEDIQDPGNFGTIIRLADWFGISQIICSENCVDVYNPKVLQATMGSIIRVNVIYTDILYFIKNFNGICYATTLNGNNIYNQTIQKTFSIIMGNEGKGISNKILDNCTSTLSIPNFSLHQETESLNVAVSTSIILSEIVRKIKYK